ncbi:MAG: metal-dependent hydrolase [Campylobacteraceae bacterium]
MTVLCADFILTCNENFDVLDDGAIVFNEKIVEIGKSSEILQKYKDAKVTMLPKNSVVMPGLINPHTHLEFSNNIATLTYGSFIPWLGSVIKHRDELSSGFDAELVAKLLDDNLKSGVTTLGNISSFGVEIFVCKSAKQKIVYFVEAIGSVPDALDALHSDFLARVHEALQNSDERFLPALSVHSPYSTHPVLAKKVIDLAKEESLLVSAHFMESLAERHWLDSGIGGFKTFFNAFNPNIKPMYRNGLEFLEMFKDVKSLLTHCVHANEDELSFIKHLNTSVTHCPTSNRLLGCGALSLKKIKSSNIPLSLGTDGLSSNISISLWDEMRNALYLHVNSDLNELAKELIAASTNGGATALNLKSGSLQKEFSSDIIAFCLKESPKELSQLPLQVILQATKMDKIYINGKEII